MAWAPDYLQPDEFKDYLRINGVDTTDDAELAGKVTAASRAIDRHCGRQFGRDAAPVKRSYTPWWNRRRGVWVVTIDDLQDATGMAIEVGGQVTTGTLEPVNALADGKAYTRLVLDGAACGADNEASITVRWGWLVFPATVVEACKIQASRFLSRRESPYGIAGSPDQGSELRLLARVDPDVGVMLGDYYRPRRPQ